MCSLLKCCYSFFVTFIYVILSVCILYLIFLCFRRQSGRHTSFQIQCNKNAYYVTYGQKVFILLVIFECFVLMNLQI